MRKLSSFKRRMLKRATLEDLKNSLLNCQLIDNMPISSYFNDNSYSNEVKFPIFQIEDYLEGSDNEIIKHVLKNNPDVWSHLWDSNVNSFDSTDKVSGVTPDNVDVEIMTPNTFLIKFPVDNLKGEVQVLMDWDDSDTWSDDAETNNAFNQFIAALKQKGLNVYKGPIVVNESVKKYFDVLQETVGINAFGIGYVTGYITQNGDIYYGPAGMSVETSDSTITFSCMPEGSSYYVFGIDTIELSQMYNQNENMLSRFNEVFGSDAVYDSNYHPSIVPNMNFEDYKQYLMNGGQKNNNK